jgi:hypothetical protein
MYMVNCVVVCNCQKSEKLFFVNVPKVVIGSLLLHQHGMLPPRSDVLPFSNEKTDLNPVLLPKREYVGVSQLII